MTFFILIAMFALPAISAQLPSIPIHDMTWEQLEQEPLDSPRFPKILWEAAQRSYRGQRWAKFFGIAAYARGRFGMLPEAQPMRLLEALALFRHCQFDRAGDLVAVEMKDVAPSLQSDFEMLQALVVVTPTVSIKRPAEGTNYEPMNLYMASHQWRLHPNRVHLVHPFKTRVELVAKCGASHAD